MDKIETAVSMIHTFKERYPDAQITIGASKALKHEDKKTIQTGITVSVEFKHETHEI